ncbi:hypothetical protein ABZ445_16320 [Streptomyces chartreusis]|uniref:hypothetical protein n=1 Tax=Streptomyces chartreusis TaxID=1969 RepID=UPI00341171E9
MAHRTAPELQPGDVVFPPYEIRTDQVTDVTPLPEPRRGEQWYRVTTEGGVFDVGCDYRWILPV